MKSHIDFAKLFVENYMAKFNAFDERCDASALFALLGKLVKFLYFLLMSRLQLATYTRPGMTGHTVSSVSGTK